MDTNTMGNLMEWGALRWLRDKYPQYTWKATRKFGFDDSRGVDIIGSIGADITKVQVKSSQTGADAFMSIMEYQMIAVIVPDEVTGGFKFARGKV